MKPLFYLFLVFFSLALPQGQDTSSSPRPVINADIIDMSRAGLAPAVLIAKIRSSQCKFDTSPDSENGRSRIVWQETEDIQTSSGLTLSRPNEVNVSRHFIKAMKKIRGE